MPRHVPRHVYENDERCCTNASPAGMCVRRSRGGVCQTREGGDEWPIRAGEIMGVSGKLGRKNGGGIISDTRHDMHGGEDVFGFLSDANGRIPPAKC